jgi:thiamine-phosphate pyrophosphorylase
MNLNKFYVPNIFYFTEDIDETILKNINKFKNIAIIYQNSILELDKFLKIKKFCYQNKIKFYIIDNYKDAIKHKLDGVIISHNNKRNLIINNPICKKNNFLILGKAHNQIEYFFKIQQFCKKIFLSPIFQTKKYNESKILKIHKFNLLSANWLVDIYALGGVNNKNYNSLKLTKSCGFGFSSFIEKTKIKKPTYF